MFVSSAPVSAAVAGDVAALYGTFPNTNAVHAPAAVATAAIASGSVGYRCAFYDDRYLIVPCGFLSPVQGNNVEIWDLINPASPSRIATIVLPLVSGATQNPAAVAVVGRWLLVISGTQPNAFVYDITNPGVPVGPTQTLTLIDFGSDIVTLGRYVVMLGYDSPGVNLYVLDPTLLSSSAATLSVYTPLSAGIPGRLAAIPQHGYVAFSGYTALNGVVITKVPEGTTVGTMTNAAFNLPIPIAHFGGEWLAVGNTGNSNLVIVNCANWASPTVAATLTLAGTLKGITPYGRYLLVASSNGNLYIVNVANPAAPVLTTTMVLGGAPTVPAAMGRYVVLGPTNSTTQFSVLDLTGLHVVAASIDGAEVGQLRVRGDAMVANRVTAGSMTIGKGGLYVDGQIAGKSSKGIRNYQATAIGVDTDINSVASTLTAVPNLGSITIAGDADSKITFSVTGTMHNSTGGSPQFRWYVRLDATGTYLPMGMWSCAAALNRVNYCNKALYTPADTNAHTYTLYYDTNGASWANGLTGVLCATVPQDDFLIFEAIEHS